ncbi:MAG TPA: PBS lyase [Cyanobacteria bacterium UBA11149]|nr:PBS lyase [Cyanobacteria bacterium UBA11367]HBE60206.1 PBS lyase [Cyanobacteria bacterium UBA11366]HBK66437.1 PBS lyase [Cyanobacteria bacterium UBA11166]HBR74430.1 PBS lyase [Cyanobacteria bacterium UBA11159]HBS70645.1 PBS lyase [Cyanobacteria bacterium UBA11153]HBW88375.1 PBS lyase [Cyanobacteria bacterium UBA11149]HCA97511.1 PBS lyase [Cyanobacteria bacterium UBA9226]
MNNFSKNTLTENQDSRIADILEQAMAAAKGNNWLLVTQCLQELPLERHRKPSQPPRERSTARKGSHGVMLDEGDRDIILKLALEVLAEGDFQERWEVAKIFPAMGEIAIAPLTDIISDENADLECRWFTCRILGEFPQSVVVMSLIQLIERNEDEDLTEMAAQSLANLGSAAIVPLSNLLAKEESRLLAVQGLAHIRHPDAIAPLLSIVKDPSPIIRAIAIEALNRFHAPQITTVLLESLKDTATAVRKEAIIGLGLRVGELPENCNLVNHLQPLLFDINIEVCRQAAVALGRVGTDAAAHALSLILKSPLTPTGLKIETVRSLSWIGTPQALEYLGAGLEGESKSTCLEIISVLGRTEFPSLKPKATQIIIDFLHSGQGICQETPVKQAIALSLGQLRESSGIDSLRELAQDSEEGIKLHAIAALKKFSY